MKYSRQLKFNKINHFLWQTCFEDEVYSAIASPGGPKDSPISAPDGGVVEPPSPPDVVPQNTPTLTPPKATSIRSSSEFFSNVESSSTDAGYDCVCGYVRACEESVIQNVWSF